MKNYTIKGTILLIIVYVFISLGLIILTDKYILTVNFYEQNGQPFTGIPEMAATIYQKVQSLIIGYSAIYLVVKLLTISFILSTGLYYYGIKTSYSNILGLAVRAEYIFLIPAAVKVLWFHFEQSHATLADWQQYYFLSAASVTDYIRPVYLYPLQTANAFELAYWFILANGIQKTTGTDYDRSLRVVLSSYVPALALWILTVCFAAMLYYPQAY